MEPARPNSPELWRFRWKGDIFQEAGVVPSGKRLISLLLIRVDALHRGCFLPNVRDTKQKDVRSKPFDEVTTSVNQRVSCASGRLLAAACGGAERSLPTGPGGWRPGLGPPARLRWGSAVGNREKIKLTLSGLGKMAPDGVETAVLFWVHLGTWAALAPGLGARTHSFAADSRSGRRSAVAIFPLCGSASGRPFGWDRDLGHIN